jgi:hypothetical protein
MLALTFFITDVPAFTPESWEAIALAVNSQVSSFRSQRGRFESGWFATVEKLIIWNFFRIEQILIEISGCSEKAKST